MADKPFMPATLIGSSGDDIATAEECVQLSSELLDMADRRINGIARTAPQRMARQLKLLQMAKDVIADIDASEHDAGEGTVDGTLPFKSGCGW